MKPCTIIIKPYVEGENNAVITTGDVSDVDIINGLKTLTKVFAQRMVKAAVKACGTNDEKVIEAYLQKQIDLNNETDIWKIIGE